MTTDCDKGLRVRPLEATQPVSPLPQELIEALETAAALGDHTGSMLHRVLLTISETSRARYVD